DERGGKRRSMQPGRPGLVGNIAAGREQVDILAALVREGRPHEVRVVRANRDDLRPDYIVGAAKISRIQREVLERLTVIARRGNEQKVALQRDRGAQTDQR